MTARAAGIDPARRAALVELEARLGHHFTDLTLLDRALTHTSYANEAAGAAPANEPLEFLGDSVLGFLVADLLHQRDPEGPEGRKSRSRARLVEAASLLRRAESLGLPALLQLGRGEEKTGGRAKTALWADAYEAVIAALYLDGGLEVARRLVWSTFGPDVEGTSDLGRPDHKSALQELLQGRGEPRPEYRLVEEQGPSHRPRFRIECVIAGQTAAIAEGYSKKQAQQEAARLALEQLLRPATGEAQ